MKKFLLSLAFLLLSFNAFASQNATTLPEVSPYPGLTMLDNINSAFNTFQSNFSGNSAPSPIVTYQLWADTTNNLLKFYDGSTWQPMGKFASSQWVPISNGVPFTIPSSTGSANAYVVTYAPVPSAYVTGQHYPFIANFANTGAATLNVNSLGAKALKKNSGTALASADITNGAVVDDVYDGTNLQVLSQLSSASGGTITSISTNNGITGGTITTSGTIGMVTQPDGTLLSNIVGSLAVPTGNTISGFFDHVFDSAQGDILYRGASVWTYLAAGTVGEPLLSGGSGGNPSYGNLPVANISASGTPSISTYLRGDGAWAATPASGFTSCTTVTSTGTSYPQTATCAGGYTLTGGGCYPHGGGTGADYINYSYPNSNSWNCAICISGSCSVNTDAFAVCCH